MSVHIRPVTAKDREEFIELMKLSAPLHGQWISPPLNRVTFDYYLARTRNDDHEGNLICRDSDEAITGVINVNNIIRGSFLSASLGYYAGIPFAGLGYMYQGLTLVAERCFNTLGLHRLEANIQPANHRSIALVKRCGFSYEGVSPKFLFIEGLWRDHERWTLLHSRHGLRP